MFAMMASGQRQSWSGRVRSDIDFVAFEGGKGTDVLDVEGRPKEVDGKG